jgi:ABC-type uncharacterized transport system ATPase component
MMVTHNADNAKRAGRTIEFRDGQVVSQKSHERKEPDSGGGPRTRTGNRPDS